MSTLKCDKICERRLPPDWTKEIYAEDYRKASLIGRFLSSTMLNEFRHCPAFYRSLTLGLSEKPDTGAFRFGRIVHTMLLEGEDRVHASYVVGGPVNLKTGRSYGTATRAFDIWLAENGFDRSTVVTYSELETARNMVVSAKNHKQIGCLLSNGWPERSVRTVMHDLPCQARLDWLRDDNVIVDVKTCSDLTRFEFNARRYGYCHQFAFYRDVCRAAGSGPLEIYAVALEKRPPYRCGVWHFPPGLLDTFSEENAIAMQHIHDCRRRNRWPTFYEETRIFTGTAAAGHEWN